MIHPIHQITAFQIVGPYSLRLRFEDGLERTIDFSPVLAGELFGPFRDASLFPASAAGCRGTNDRLAQRRRLRSGDALRLATVRGGFRRVGQTMATCARVDARDGSSVPKWPDSCR